MACAHPVLLMRAEVKEDVQVLELARRALEDQVSQCRHAQVGATLQMRATLSLPPSCLPPSSQTKSPGPGPQAAAPASTPSCLNCNLLTSSSQYFRITSKALSVISGASKTTLVKTLPKTDTCLAGEVQQGGLRPSGPTAPTASSAPGPEPQTGTHGWKMLPL